MDPRLLRAWDFRPEVLLVLLLAGTLFSLGWWRLRRGTSRRFARSWRLVVYLTGLGLLALALISPIDSLGAYLLSMHMIQHLLLVMLAPVFLLITNPLPFTMWGMPDGLRLRVGGLLEQRSRLRRALAAITTPGLVWIALVVVLVGWHDPRAYDAALRSPLVHNLEHLSFFVVAMFFWWHITAAGPQLHGVPTAGVRIALLLITVPVTMGIGIVIALSAQPIYLNYITVPRVMGLSVMEDQRLAGAIMWIPGSMMLILAALTLLARIVSAEERKPPLSLDSTLGNPLNTRPREDLPANQ
ncbi:MAG: cytochrome c oxidase assembly protein [Anaerolineales bacterium]